ncbi:MAG: hypothetical protein GEV10_27610 [Streptosporangiales bacterium]|nr:hypothetical protein [Streptosporangiales bacterium]
MKPPPFEFRRPGTVDETVALLAEHGDEAKVLAGGQSLMPLLNMRLAVPSVVVDVGRLGELREVAETAAGATRYGARVVHSDVEDGVVTDRTGGLLRTAAAGIGYRAIRNRGTLGGSLAHSDASAEWPVVMAALDATVVARSPRGERSVPCREFVQGYFTNALDDDELLVAVDVPTLRDTCRWGMHKAARKPGEFAESLAVVVAELDGDGAVLRADAWLGAARDVPVRLTAVEEALVGRRVDEVAAPDVTALVIDQLGEPADPEERYGVHLHGVTVGRAVTDLGLEAKQ